MDDNKQIYEAPVMSVKELTPECAILQDSFSDASRNSYGREQSEDWG